MLPYLDDQTTEAVWTVVPDDGSSSVSMEAGILVHVCFFFFNCTTLPWYGSLSSRF